MDPIIGGALIGGASSLLGGALGRSSSKSIAREQMAMQKEFAQHGVAWRVEDAKAAGLHPLFALNASIPTYSPSVQVDPMGQALVDAGQHVGRAVAAQETSDQKIMKQLMLTKLASDIGESDARADYYRSLATRDRQAGGPGLPSPVLDSPVGSVNPYQVSGDPVVMQVAADKAPRISDWFKVSPGEVTSGQRKYPGITAGSSSPLMTEYVTPSGAFRLLLPSKSASEPLETVGESFVGNVILTAGIIAANVARYGPEWLDQAERRVSAAGKHMIHNFRRDFATRGGAMHMRPIDSYGRR